LDDLRNTLASDPMGRARLLSGLGGALADRAEAAPSALDQKVAAAEQAGDKARGDLVEALLATGTLLWVTPAIAARVMLSAQGSNCSILVVVLCP
jgi:hypothetical protein